MERRRAQTKLNQRGVDIASFSLSYQRPISRRNSESVVAFDHGNITKDEDTYSKVRVAPFIQEINKDLLRTDESDKNELQSRSEEDRLNNLEDQYQSRPYIVAEEE